MDKNITIPVTDISPLVKHAEELYEAGTSPEYDFDKRSSSRSREKFIHDRIQGKIGELALAEFIRVEMGMEATVDLDIYDSEETIDYADLKTINDKQPAQQFDVKTTKDSNLWLMIRKTIWEMHSPSDPIILATVDSDMCYPGNEPIFVTIRGWMQTKDISTEFSRGERLYHPQTKDKIGPQLKTDNMCIPIKDIPQRSPEELKGFVRSELTD